MNLSFCSFASGSSGNCYLIKSRESAILIDAGISTKKIHAALEELGTERSEISGVFVTHEHSDHVKGLKVLTKQNPLWNVYASEETCLCLRETVHNSEQIRSLDTDHITQVGDMRIRAIDISHDAAHPVCYTVTSGNSKITVAVLAEIRAGQGQWMFFYGEQKQSRHHNKQGNSKITVLTDTGYVPERVRPELESSDLIVIEANHEVNMLKAGPYPYRLKLRILGDSGHLSNETAGEILSDVMSRDDRYRTILLAHLSRENNFPQLALQTVTNILEEHRFYPGKHMRLEVLKREGISGFTEI